jgi:hypothetical protein
VQHRDPLVGGEAAQEVIGPFPEREGRIAEANRFDDDPFQVRIGCGRVLAGGTFSRYITHKPNVSRLLRSGQCSIYSPPNFVKRFDS